MFSYRHGFHAGNFADVLKHHVQVEILSYLKKKEAPFDYIDTHAGAGTYRLQSAMAQKNQEYLSGIGKLYGSDALPELGPYLKLVAELNSGGSLNCYPGSPMVAARLLRPQDRAWLFELHPGEVESLRENFRSNKQCRVREEDGFHGLAALLPTQSRRALILIDPPYEQKLDYQRVVSALSLIHRKMSTATVALWYPVVARRQIDLLIQQIAASGIRKIDRYELGVRADSEGHGMTASGMIVVNPPWTLREQMERLLPELAGRLSEDGGLHYRCELVVGD